MTIAGDGDIRTFDIRPRLALAVGVATAVFALLYFAATGYLVFRDDLLAASLARQARLQQAYEDRIASLRADIDRLTSRQLLNQEAFEAKLERLVGRQAMLDARQDIIAGMSQAARGAGLAPEADASSAPADEPAEAKPFITGSLAGARAPLAAAMLRDNTDAARLPASDQTVQIGELETSLDQLASDQVAYVEAMAEKATAQADKIAGVLKRLGHPPAKPDDAEAVGGPFIPLDDNVDPETFRTSVNLVTGEIDRLTELRRTASRLPLARPLAHGSITSGFGARIDPFLGRPAMHPGIDFKAPVGDSVKATAAGTVTTASYTGGYGYMVEVDHGLGVSTRYGHLSRILVKPGDTIAAGDLIGKSGSSGRSTGPHLHYEIRLNGRAIDPMAYLKAAAELAPLL